MSTATALPGLERMVAFRPQMMSYATRKLGDTSLAEDIVQDTYVAALDKADSFRGQATLKTWVFAILKHKITDALRGRYRRNAHEVMIEDDPDDDSLEHLLFRHDGHWYDEETQADLGSPEQMLHNRQFWLALQHCLNGLPGLQAQVFLMRECLGMSPTEISAQTQLSCNNIHVMLYRARLRLQKCLQINWLSEEPGAES